MASNQLRTLRPNTSIENVGRLHWHKTNTSILDFGSNKQWLRYRNKLQSKLEAKELWQLFNLIGLHDRGAVVMDYETIAATSGDEQALAILRSYILEAHLCNELVRLGVDFTKPLKPQVKALRHKSRERFNKLHKALRYIQESHAFTHGTPLRELPQRSPNAPNTLPAFSLAAA